MPAGKIACELRAVRRRETLSPALLVTLLPHAPPSLLSQRAVRQHEGVARRRRLEAQVEESEFDVAVMRERHADVALALCGRLRVLQHEELERRVVRRAVTRPPPVVDVTIV